MQNSDKFFSRWSQIGLFTALCGVAVFIFHKWIFPVIFPFLIAYTVALSVRRPARVISKRIKLPEKATRVILMIFFLLSLCLIVFIVLQRLFFEAGELLEYLGKSDVIEKYVTAVANFLSGIRDRFPFFKAKFGGEASDLIENISNVALEGMLNAISSLSGKLPGLVAKILTFLPEVLFSAVLTLLAAFYFCLDPKIIGRALAKILPREPLLRLHALRRALRHSAICYLRGYGIILLITFAELFFAFTILKIRYAFILAIIIAVLDLLPIIGVGTVLLPWSGIVMLQGNFRLGISLLVILALETLIRQFIEPKIIGRSVDLHPLVMLFSMYAGNKLLGFWGILAGPAIAIIIKTAYPVLFRSDKKYTANVQNSSAGTK